MRSTFLCIAIGLTAVELGFAQQLQPRMGDPVPGLTTAELTLFKQGRTAFAEPLLPSEGRGPIFNDVACGTCHNIPAIGGFGTNVVTRFGKAAVPGVSAFDPLVSLGGTLLQEQADDPSCIELVPAQADVTASRITPITFGAGLLEAIPDSEIMANAMNQPAGLNGVASMVTPIENAAGPMRPARFGWKGGIATVHSFSLDASLNEMGLTSTFLMNENAPNGNMALLAACDTVADPEDVPDALGFRRTERFTHFQAFSAAPPQVPASGMTGEIIFNNIGCADCHRPSYTTGTGAAAALGGQNIRPYSDFLLHDMGTQLGDGIVEGNASETEMMTRALWGLRGRPALLHDGRSTGGTFFDNVNNSVLEHGGEGATARSAYMGLSSTDKDLLVDFLASLGQIEFDFEEDFDLDEFDWFFILPFFNGPAPALPITPDETAAICDHDQDGDFDLVEFGLFQRAFDGQ